MGVESSNSYGKSLLIRHEKMGVKFRIDVEEDERHADGYHDAFLNEEKDREGKLAVVLNYTSSGWCYDGRETMGGDVKCQKRVKISEDGRSLCLSDYTSWFFVS